MDIGIKMGKKLHKLVYSITRLKIKRQIVESRYLKKNTIVLWMVIAISTITIYRILIHLT